MRPKQITRLATDAAMTIALLLLMDYAAVMALFALIGFLAAKTLSKAK